MKDLAFRFGEFSSRVVFGGRSVGLRDGKGGSLRVYDTNTLRLFGGEFGAGPGTVEVPPGEESKSLGRAEEVLERAVQAGLGRDGVMVGIGGGVVCDLTAFCASVYLRGCSLALVPTTLLAMVDASLGGKTGVNLLGYKNMVGTFYPAAEIVVRTDLLPLLPGREYRSGLGEVIKTAMLGDLELLELLERRREEVQAREAGLLTEVVERCLAVKGKVVEEDFREGGERASLNLGHTFAHALESVAGLGDWSHGQAVAWGLGRAMRLGVRLGITDPAWARRVGELLAAYGFGQRPRGASPEQLLAAMGADKKKREGRLQFVLQRGPADTLVRPVPEDLVLETLGEDLP